MFPGASDITDKPLMSPSEFQRLKILSHTESQLILFTTTLGLGFSTEEITHRVTKLVWFWHGPESVPPKLPRLLGVVRNRTPYGIFQDKRDSRLPDDKNHLTSSLRTYAPESSESESPQKILLTSTRVTFIIREVCETLLWDGLKQTFKDDSSAHPPGDSYWTAVFFPGPALPHPTPPPSTFVNRRTKSISLIMLSIMCQQGPEQPQWSGRWAAAWMLPLEKSHWIMNIFASALFSLEKLPLGFRRGFLKRL